MPRFADADCIIKLTTSLLRVNAYSSHENERSTTDLHHDQVKHLLRTPHLSSTPRRIQPYRDCHSYSISLNKYTPLRANSNYDFGPNALSQMFALARRRSHASSALFQLFIFRRAETRRPLETSQRRAHESDGLRPIAVPAGPFPGYCSHLLRYVYMQNARESKMRPYKARSSSVNHLNGEKEVRGQ